MTFTVDTYTLNVSDFSEISDTVGTEWLAYENEKITKKKFTYGMLRTWTLRCFEIDVAWSSSAAKYLQGKMGTDEKVTFTIDAGNMHNVSNVQVYVKDLEIRYGRGSKSTKFKREFTATLQEAESPS